MEAAKPAAGGLSSDSKLWGALCYVFPILVPLFVMLTEKKQDKFVLFHAWQALILAIAMWAVSMVVAVVTFGVGGLCFPLVWLVMLYFGYKAYQGEKFMLPTVGEMAEKNAK